MEDGPLRFPIVTHKDVALAHHLEVGHSLSNLRFLFVPSPFLNYDEEIGRPREVVDILITRLLILPVSSSRSRSMVPIPLVLMSLLILLASV